MTVWQSSKLGWTAGQDISTKFATLAKSFKAGDALVLDHMYKISGHSIKLPDNFTLSAKTGAGLNIVDGAKHTNALLELGNRNTIDNVTITHSGLSGARNTKKTIKIVDKVDVKILNSKFEGDIGGFVDVSGGEGFTVQGSHFEGAYGQISLGGNNVGTRIDRSIFEGSAGDGIKTVASGRAGVQRVTITNSVFENNLRDGIDTTGGFKDSVVSNSIFRSNGVSGLDIKTLIESKADLNVERMNKNIIIENSQFINNNAAVIVSTLDRADLLNASNASKWSVQDVYVRDSIVEQTAGHSGRAFHIKAVHDIYWNNMKFLGNVTEKKIWSSMNETDPDVIKALNYNIVGTNTKTGAPRPVSNGYPFEAGPGGDSAPIVKPDPQPAPEPGPTKSEPTTPPSSSDDAVFERRGESEFNRKAGDIVNVKHSKALEIDQGSIAFTFDADRIDLRQGLVSKDAKGNGDHFSAWVEKGQLRVRFQNDNSETTLSKAVNANVEYDVVATFDDKKVALWVDGKQVGSKSLDMDWSDNTEWMQIGGLGWSSAHGSKAASNPFDGTISDVMIFDHASSPGDLGLL